MMKLRKFDYDEPVTFPRILRRICYLARASLLGSGLSYNKINEKMLHSNEGGSSHCFVNGSTVEIVTGIIVHAYALVLQSML